MNMCLEDGKCNFLELKKFSIEYVNILLKWLKKNNLMEVMFILFCYYYYFFKCIILKKNI